MTNALTKYIEKNEQIKDSYEHFIKMAQKLIKELIENILEYEFEQQRKLYKPKSYRQRNGYYKRSLVTEYGLITDIKVPRFRGIKFLNSFFGPWQRRVKMVEDFVTQIFVQGHSYRDIRRIYGMKFGDNISLRTINKIMDKTLLTVEEFHKRTIKEQYSVIWIDGIYFPVKQDSIPKKKGKNYVVLVVLGLNKRTNKKEIIDYLPTGSENMWAYTRLLRSLLFRGLNPKDIQVIVHDGDQAIKSAVNRVFGDSVNQQDCIFHKLMNINSFIKDKSRKSEILKDASLVYKSTDYLDYIKRRKSFILKYRYREPDAVRVFRNDEYIKTKFALPDFLYHLINTNNSIDRTFREVRRRTDAIGCFENVKSLDKIFFLIINFINQTMGNASFVKNLAFTQF